MASGSTLTGQIIAKARSFRGIRAAMARLSEVLAAPSYGTDAERSRTWFRCTEETGFMRPPEAGSVMMLGLKHPQDSPELDWWIGGNTEGNRRLIHIAATLKRWLRREHALEALSLPYRREKGGVFLKDAAVIAGLGIIGKNNLLLHPEWGPRIRLRAILLDADLRPTPPIKIFDPCSTCEKFCHSACPQKAFQKETYHPSACLVQMKEDLARKAPGKDNHNNGKPAAFIKYCRACEFACPIGG